MRSKSGCIIISKAKINVFLKLYYIILCLKKFKKPLILAFVAASLNCTFLDFCSLCDLPYSLGVTGPLAHFWGENWECGSNYIQPMLYTMFFDRFVSISSEFFQVLLQKPEKNSYLDHLVGVNCWRNIHT